MADTSSRVGDVPHPFDPWRPDWFMPRCKVCREFEEHELHHHHDKEQR